MNFSVKSDKTDNLSDTPRQGSPLNDHRIAVSGQPPKVRTSGRRSFSSQIPDAANMNASVLINQTSGETEWYTPAFIIEAARKAMGSIELDPASSPIANRIVSAVDYFTKEQDGLSQEWRAASVWVNWPFGREENPKWVNKIIEEWAECRAHRICCICYACTSEAWFQPLAVFPQCFLSPRTNYLLPDGTKKPGVTKGSVVTYLGPNNDRFHDAFKSLGTVKVRYA